MEILECTIAYIAKIVQLVHVVPQCYIGKGDGFGPCFLNELIDHYFCKPT